MNDHAHTERQALIACVQPATAIELQLNEQLAFEKARADRMETAIREVLLMLPNSVTRKGREILEHSLTP